MLLCFYSISHSIIAAEANKKMPPALLDTTWATAPIMDEFGYYTDFTVAGVTQRLRWIAAGEFIMGSPKLERLMASQRLPMNFFQSEIQHKVILTEGYWLADSECTQQLWSAVMGTNESKFGDNPQRPVERVSWDSVQQFLEKLNGHVGASIFRLPTEAQWEYACRAGTMTATYIGGIDYVGRCNAPILDEIAWYMGNSGHGWQGAKGYGWDSSKWIEKQYDHTLAGTWPVKQKKPNAWGLYDMIGNVSEWCWDRFGDYPSEDIVSDPVGPDVGPTRVHRGGAWNGYPQGLRSAFRDRNTHDDRFVHLGFRLAAQVIP
jgi:formylglycine-generating enzyme required for sulfatase activity